MTGVELSFNPYLAFSWSVLAGFLMSMGAGGGGILAGIGHLSILGIGDANMVKVMNQVLEFVSRMFSVPIYHRQKRLVWPLAISFGVGAPIGAVAGSWVSKHYLADMHVYRPVFGALVALVAVRVLYEGWTKRRTKAARPPARAVGQVRPAEIGLTRVRLQLNGEPVEFNPLTAAAGGFAISFVGASLGVGGGFLVTPFMASVLLFPMFFVLGTSLVALMLPLAVSVVTYLALQVHVDMALVLVEVPGVIVGSFIGPTLNHRMNEKAMRAFVSVVLLGIGIYYVM